MARCRVPVARWAQVCLLLLRVDAAGKHGNAEFQKVELPHHSFSAPLEFSNLLGDWMLSGSSIFLRERLLLHPHVNERQGFAWNKRPLKTNDFQLTATFVANGAKDVSQAPSDQSFAFWFVRQNISGDFNETRMIRAASWKQGLEEEGYMLSGSKALFEGIGAVFSTSDVAKKPNTAVSFVSNDNHQSLSYFVDVPTSNAKILDFRNKEVEFKFRVQPTLVQAFLTLDGQTHECFSVDRAGFPVKVGGFIGFTAWSGSAGDGSMISDAISVTKVEVINFDDEAIGEDVVGATAEETSAYSELMSSNARHFADQKSQTEHLSRVTKMLASHLKETKPAYDVMSFQVSGMMDALNKLDRDCRVLTKEMRILENEKISNRRQAKRPKNNLDELKSHVFGLRRILEKEGQVHLSKIDAVQKNLNEVKEQASKVGGSTMLGKLVDQTRLLEQSVLASTSQTTWMLLILLVVIVVLGVLMFNRMQYYEKKHFI